MQRIIFHVDVNSAFLSWEAARRVSLGEQDIRLIPSVIGGDIENRTGVVLAKSIPAKKFNIKTGEPIAIALRKCSNLYIAKPDYKLYQHNSKAFMDICREYTPVVEKYSIDECFLDMTGMSRMYPDIMAVAYEIKDKIRDKLGFTVNIGIGSNKLLAKMASDFQKPDKVHTLFSEEVPKKLWPLPISELFTVGSATSEKLEKAYIRTIGELAKTDIKRLQSIVGVKFGNHIHEFANGIDNSEVLAEPEETKGYSISTTLAEDITEKEDAYNVLISLADSVSTRMRKDNAKALCIGVTIRGNDFKDKSHQKSLMAATDITDEIYNIAKKLFDELWDKRTPLRLLGISLTNLSKEETGQISFFEDSNKEKSKKMDKAIDSIRNKFGMNAISRASAMQTQEVGKKYKAQIEENG